MLLAKGAFFVVCRGVWMPVRENVFEIGEKTVGT
jgi:hypothetical protein